MAGTTNTIWLKPVDIWQSRHFSARPANPIVEETATSRHCLQASMKGFLMIYAQIVLFGGFDPLDVVAPYEVLSAGGIAAGGALTVELVSAEGPREVVSGSGGLVLRATGTLDPDNADLIIVPGAAGPISEPEDGRKVDTIPTLLARTVETRLPELMRKALDNPKVTVATVCGGSLALAMAGLLQGRHAVTHHMGMDVLGATGAIPIRARVVDDGDLVTAGGVTSGLDLGLYLLERELGPRIAHAVEELFEYEQRGTVWHNKGLEAIAI
jgi:putative intracellular protease/amidase